MKSLKQIISEIDPNNVRVDNCKWVSYAKLYDSLKRDGDKTNYRRLKLLVSLYPTILERNNFRIIEKVVKEPTGRLMHVSRRRELYRFEEILNRKYNAETGDRAIGTYRITDLYEYFGIK